MAMDEGFASGIVVGTLLALPIGVCLGWILAQYCREGPSAVLFERDENGRIREIHYVPGKVEKGG